MTAETQILTSEQQDHVVDSLNEAVATKDAAGREDRREQAREMSPEEQKALRRWHQESIVGNLRELTEHDRAVMRMTNFAACSACAAVFPYEPKDNDHWFLRDNCPRCNVSLFGAMRFRGQKTDLKNPYLEDIVRLFKGKGESAPGDRMDRMITSSILSFSAREIFTDRYAWAIPDEQAIDLIAKYGPILEIGAGRGYWAWLLSQRGVEVQAFDKTPPPNHWHHENDHVFYDVQRAGPEVAKLKKFREHTLFLCWPPYTDQMAFKSLQNYRGQHVIYVGESDGCTGDGAFHKLLERDWKMIDDSNIPQWGGVHDYVMVYQRK